MAVLQTATPRKRRPAPALDADSLWLLKRLGEVEGLEALDEHNLRDRRVYARLQLYLFAVKALESLVPIRGEEAAAVAVTDSRLFIRHTLAQAEEAVAESEQPERLVDQWQRAVQAYWCEHKLPSFE